MVTKTEKINQMQSKALERIIEKLKKIMKVFYGSEANANTKRTKDRTTKNSVFKKQLNLLISLLEIFTMRVLVLREVKYLSTEESHSVYQKKNIKTLQI